MNYNFDRHVADVGDVTIDGETWVRVWQGEAPQGSEVRHETGVNDANGLHVGYGPNRKIARKIRDAVTTIGWAFCYLWIRASDLPEDSVEPLPTW